MARRSEDHTVLIAGHPVQQAGAEPVLNARRIKAGVSIDELAEDIARHASCEHHRARPVRRYRRRRDRHVRGSGWRPALSARLNFWSSRSAMAKTTPVPCVVREDGIPEEDSLAENVQRGAAASARSVPGLSWRCVRRVRSEEDIAAAFFVAVSVVKQRLASHPSRPSCSTSMPTTA